LDNINQRKNQATKIENDLNYLKEAELLSGSKSSSLSTQESASKMAAKSEDNNDLVQSSSSNNLDEINKLEEQEADQIRRRRLEHFKPSASNQ
jgi:hypothetical protein